MVKIYTMDIRTLSDPADCPQVLDGLGKQRSEKILKCKQEKSRKQSLGAGLLLKQCFDELGIEMDAITYNVKGKPEVEGSYFNLSHSEDYVILAVGEMQIGCDIEKIQSGREGIAKRYFTEAENRYLETFEGEARIQEFYRIWTIKESYTKMTGEGMTFSKSLPEVRFEEEICIYQDGSKVSCTIKEYDMEGYKCAVCIEKVND